ncbi:MAG TPA: ornithine cyclodeaminase family protein [Bryobacteraceae bacterium]|nr:ornithine cyclodeaminase family protein [Bryobacteraceae bacterium]
MLHITEEEVRRLLPMREAVPLMRQVFESLGRGEARNHPRRRLAHGGGAMLHTLVGSFGDYIGAKVYCSHTRHEPHFLLLLFDARNACPAAVVEANWLGQIRTGAASGYATDLLAIPDAKTLAVIGSGFQARSQLEAMLVVRRFQAVRVWSRNAEHREKFARECSEAFEVEIEPADTAERAVRGADVIVTMTNAKEPVLEAAWVAPHALVNAAGSNNPKRREIPADLVRNASLIAIDSIEQARAESGDLILALDDAGWHDPKLVELADLAIGKRALGPRTAPVIFKSNGLGVEDVAAAALVYERVKNHS